MSNITTNDVMNKLYGSNATQMVGGKSGMTKKSNKLTKKTSKIKGSADKGSKIEMCPYPEYIKNENFKLFMSSFYMIKRICHAYSSSIYIIPPKTQLEKMIKDFEKTLKENDIKPNTIEAYHFAVSNDLPYKRCIFNMFADSTAENYRLDEIKIYRNFGLVKRTNGLREQYYFQYNSDSQITIFPSEDCVAKEGKKAKLLACCDNGIYVFEGELPEPKLIFQKQVISKGFMGGSAKTEELKMDMLKKALKKGEIGAYKFICSFALAEMLNKHNFKEVSKNFSGDLIHSAFRIAFDNNVDQIPTKKFSDADLSKTFDQLLKSFKLGKTTVDVADVQKSFKSSYLSACKKNKTPKDVSNAFITSIKKKYSKIGNETLKADIACNLYNMGYANDIAAILSICKSVDEPSSTALSDASVIDYDSSENEIISSKLAKLLCRSLCAAPLIGVISKSYYPIKYNYKDVQSNLKGGEFYESDLEEQTDEDEDDEYIEAVEQGEQNEPGEPDEQDNIDDYI